MMAQKHVLSLIDAGGEIRRAPLIGMQFLHEGAMRPANLLGRRPRLHAKDLIGLLFRHFTAAGRGDEAVGVMGIAVVLTTRDGERYVAHVLPLTSGARRCAAP